LAVQNAIMHISRRAMACEFEVRFPADRYPQGMRSALDALDLVEKLEEEISFFRLGSELHRINLLAAEEPVEVAPKLFDVLQLAMTLYDETSGAYDITSTPLWEAWGFARRQGAIPTDEQLAKAKDCVGGNLIELDPERCTIRFRKPGVRINLGSIGKGFALDACSEKLQAAGMKDFLIHGGQSSVLAQGEQPADPSAATNENQIGWEIGIPHPLQSKRRLGIVRLENRALGTSALQFQSFRHHGHRYGHILDPRSGWPVENILSTTVLAPTAALADALSTAFYVLGPAKSLDYCQKHPEIGVILLTTGQDGGCVDVHQAGLDDRVLAYLDA
jgi:FAD:protein FMN transferase